MEDLIAWCRGRDHPAVPPTSSSGTHRCSTPPTSPIPTWPRPTASPSPNADESFDFAFAHSVFTHLPADSVANYLGETHRVLRPGGILYATWFLFDTRPDGHPNPIVDAMQLEPSGDVAVRFPDIPDAATGIGPGTSGTSTAREGSPSSTPIHPGFRRMQDAVVAVRRPSDPSGGTADGRAGPPLIEIVVGVGGGTAPRLADQLVSGT